MGFVAVVALVAVVAVVSDISDVSVVSDVTSLLITAYSAIRINTDSIPIDSQHDLVYTALIIFRNNNTGLVPGITYSYVTYPYVSK